MSKPSIKITGARQNNLKGLDLSIPLGELVVMTGVSGSGKSSLAFDTVYAEGQRRYVETFSPYARQFLDRMDRPAVDRIDGIPPSIAIDQTNPVRTSRSTVGTMTELNDHLKLLFARAAQLFCSGCGRQVRRDTTSSIVQTLHAADIDRLMVTFTVEIEDATNRDQVRAFLASQGYTRIHAECDTSIEVIQDRLRPGRDPQRLVDALDNALHMGSGRVQIYPIDADRQPGAVLKFSTDLHCPDCDYHYREPQPNHFSFNSPLGACPTCRGFGRIIGIDPNLVVPDTSKTLAAGAIKPLQSDSYLEKQGDLMRVAKRRGVATDVPWRDLPQAHKEWVWHGDGASKRNGWHGLDSFFDWLEAKSYKMHIRVLLSKYRAYNCCLDCGGARLQTESLLYRIGSRPQADSVLAPALRHRPQAVTVAAGTWQALPGLNLYDVVQLPISKLLHFFADLNLPAGIDKATDLMLNEIRARLDYLQTVGLGYLTLDRQSRTLSGGEVQRINLTTALGASLVNTLFVLDEPSIGLHPRDMQRMVNVLHRLRNAGNSLLVVEHDPQVMLAADRILDIGPGPGEHGGELIFQGTPKQLLRSRRSRTAAYLSGREQITSPPALAASHAPVEIIVRGASAHNLKGIDLVLPLHQLVCVTGVSGSGKSTLIHDVLFKALAKLKGHSYETPGAHIGIDNADAIDDVVLLDQSQIGKSSRSNPASYVGAFDAIRKQFALQDMAKSRRYSAGTFSFNAGTGRCPTCRGTGFEHVEMQFLSDVYLRCPDCNGSRYRSPVLAVKMRGKSIAEVLAMTVTEAICFFSEQRNVQRALAPLAAVGLGYLRLGQPVPTLSGGEAQRLKLAGYLAQAGKHKTTDKGLLFLLDEPTTGLHFDDIAVLLQALRRLTYDGHSVVVIEHNLDVMRAADWLIDLGPEGGEYGGEIVCSGTPDAIAAHLDSHTGAALRRYQQALQQHRLHTIVGSKSRKANGNRQQRHAQIAIYGAREHNLKNIDLNLPRDNFTVVTGISGSGKSTLAFDILFAEGQRRYLESLNAYARQFVQPASRAAVDAVYGLPPTVAIEQRTSRGGRKSTVATLTESYHFLRLLFVKLGIQYCPDCQVAIEPQPREVIIERIIERFSDKKLALFAPLVIARKGLYKELAKWADRKGHTLLRVDGELLPTHDWPMLERHREHNIELPMGELQIGQERYADIERQISTALEHGKGVIRVVQAGQEYSYSTRRACPCCNRGFDEPDPRLFSYNSKHGWCPGCYGTGALLPEFDQEESGEEGHWLSRGEPTDTCPMCHGARLRPEALSIQFSGKSIAELASMSIDTASDWFNTLQLDARQTAIAKDVLAEICSRLRFLRQVGLGYLTLDRAAPTLSGGEAQRIRLAAQLGSNLKGVCYVLDEPSIGLHARDNSRLLDMLTALRQQGNTVVVVEHDEEAIRRAEHIIDLGPGAGVLGGQVVAAGTAKDLIRNPHSVTGRYLANPIQHPLRASRRGQSDMLLAVKNASQNNLQNINLSVPLARLVCVTGVSGSGKSTLVREVLVLNLNERIKRSQARMTWRGCQGLSGTDHIERVLEIDQTPIGKTPRSCPATYIGFWDAIRKLFAASSEARMRGWGAGRFSFNIKGGRCDVCEGQGLQRVEMNFLPDVKVPCEGCSGARFNPATLAVTWRDKSVGDILQMSVDEAVEFFVAHSSIHFPLTLLQDVGLGYLTLGQHSPTLSGGEAQRIKLVSELARTKPDMRKRPAKTLYVLDEPTVGLHMADVARLIEVLHRLVDDRHSVIVIEHNLDVIAEADWIIDLGPEAGSRGGKVVAQGTPEQVVRKKTATAIALKPLIHSSEKG